MTQAAKIRALLEDYPEVRNDPDIANLLPKLDEIAERLYQESTCRFCGKSMPIQANGRPRMYCNNTCRQRAYRAKLTDIKHDASIESRRRVTLSFLR
jgi:hypothetical protein